MDSITNFEPELSTLLPDTHALLVSARLVVHPRVSRVVLHGSRGLGRNNRPDSDIDLSLVVDALQGKEAETEYHAVIETTLRHWRAAIEPDLAVIFDLRQCNLVCFEQTTWNENLCRLGGVDCFGLYKIQKGFGGLVTNAGIQVERMYPCLKIWQRR